MYNDIGQLRFSQNAQQEVDATYSYTKYDELGRIVEVGLSSHQIAAVFGPSPDVSIGNSKDFPNSVVDGQPLAETQKTITTYTTAETNLTYVDGSEQRFLQNRVSKIMADEDGDITTTADQNQTYFSYDPHGNVEWMIQDIAGLGKKHIGYQYDLISGNVLVVSYNAGKSDQFYHRYTYDSDNRIVNAETSVDDKIWDRDAHYSYYAHGPLKRVEIGEDNIQGIDYVYTLQGWLKGINHPSLIPSNDPGLDDATVFAEDAFAMTLGYFSGDFINSNSPYDAIASNFLEPAEDLVNDSIYIPGANLYNGNIATWTAQTMATGNGTYEQLTANAYTYDDINRIVTSNFDYYSTGWSNNTNNEYNSAYTYDGNGNITALSRNGQGVSPAEVLMDNMAYNYISETNKLDYVNEDNTIDSHAYTTDIDDGQVAGNYEYDAIGNLIADEQEGIAEISWTAYGKVSEIMPAYLGTGLNKAYIQFAYDATGNRVSKTVYPSVFNASNNFDALATLSNIPTITYYVRDASGNVMSVYSKDEASGIVETKLIEQPIYGSDRLGTRMAYKETATTTTPVTACTPSLAPKIRKTESDCWGIAFREYNGFINVMGGMWQEIDINKLYKGEIRFDGAFSLTVDTIPFANKSLNEVVVGSAEDEDGNCLYNTYNFSNADVLIGMGKPSPYMEVVASNGNIITGSFEKPSIKSSSISMKDPTNADADNYIFFNLNKDMGSAPFINDVNTTSNTITNQVKCVDNTGQPNNYFNALALIDDDTDLSWLFTAKEFKDGMNSSVQIVGFPITSNGVDEAKVLAEFPTKLKKRNSLEIQISPDGRYLAVSNQAEEVGPGGKPKFPQIVMYKLNSACGELTNPVIYKIMELEDRNYEIVSFDFSPNGEYIYYYSLGKGQNRVLVKRIRLSDSQVVEITVPEAIIKIKGTVRRAKDGSIYINPGVGQILSKIESPNTGSEIVTSIDLTTVIGTTYNLTSGLPLQAHRVRSLPMLITDSIDVFSRRIDQKSYELKDHLGNVRAVVSDRKKWHSGISSSTVVESNDFNNDTDSAGWKLSGNATFHLQHQGSLETNVKPDNGLFNGYSYKVYTGISANTNYQFSVFVEQFKNGAVFDIIVSDDNGEIARKTISDDATNEILAFQTSGGATQIIVKLQPISTTGDKEAKFKMGNTTLTQVNIGSGVESYTADLKSASNYYPFGMPQPGRTMTGDYRYGFNGMEKDDEIKGSGNSYDFGARIYDPRLMRWLSLDPLASAYPSISDYASFGNNPIAIIDPDGRKLVAVNKDVQESISTYLGNVIGVDNGFRFKGTKLKVNKRYVKRILNDPSVKQEKKDIVESLAQVVNNKRITVNVSTEEDDFLFTKSRSIYETQTYDGDGDGVDDTFENGQLKKRRVKVDEIRFMEVNGKKATTSITFFNKLINESNVYVVIHKPDANSPISGEGVTSDEASTFFHEVLDHGLDVINKGTVIDSEKTQKGKVKFFNKARMLQGKPKRTGTNHE
ncbi:MAG: RHS repeat-associated core domain-containing protein [Flavobacteriales bacterium]|nr:RHS repeat-associated core domain-containing protein [Flavobacteriales bacterium]